MSWKLFKQYLESLSLAEVQEQIAATTGIEKVQFVLDEFNANCEKMWNVNQWCSVDEGMEEAPENLDI